MGLNFKVFIQLSCSPQAEVLSSQKELQLGLFYLQCQRFIVHPLESILWYSCHTQVITELPLGLKKKKAFLSVIQEQDGKTPSWVRLGLYLQNKMSF